MYEPQPGRALSTGNLSPAPTPLSMVELPRLVAEGGLELAMEESLWMEGPRLIASALGTDIPVKATQVSFEESALDSFTDHGDVFRDGCSFGLLSLAEWHQEAVLWRALQDIPFFRDYLLCGTEVCVRSHCRGSVKYCRSCYSWLYPSLSILQRAATAGESVPSRADIWSRRSADPVPTHALVPGGAARGTAVSGRLCPSGQCVCSTSLTSAAQKLSPDLNLACTSGTNCITAFGENDSEPTGVSSFSSKREPHCVLSAPRLVLPKLTPLMVQGQRLRGQY
ncbi:hypothetical protein J4Q44_G00336420 [Coregonus suidteri]|uniref:Uncharacterized protein n=1 Tax=Coregonus suidteri TaxID=861788 RepID=A0AAN8KJI8_9TELE